MNVHLIVKKCNYNSCTSCDDGYVVVDGLCIECMVSNCSNCKPGDDNYCEICYEGFYAINGECVLCEDGFDKCSLCPIDSPTCSKCFDSYGLNLIKDSENFSLCEECKIGNCSYCDGDPNICLECKTGYYLYDNLCNTEPLIIDDVFWEGHGDDDDSPPVWIIVVIIIASVIVVVGIILLIVFCVKKKKN